MDIISVAVIIIVIGILLWAANSYIPMDGKIKNILNVAVVIAVILWLLKIFGVLDSVRNIHT